MTSHIIFSLKLPHFDGLGYLDWPGQLGHRSKMTSNSRFSIQFTTSLANLGDFIATKLNTTEQNLEINNLV